MGTRRTTHWPPGVSRDECALRYIFCDDGARFYLCSTAHPERHPNAPVHDYTADSDHHVVIDHDVSGNRDAWMDRDEVADRAVVPNAYRCHDDRMTPDCRQARDEQRTVPGKGGLAEGYRAGDSPVAGTAAGESAAVSDNPFGYPSAVGGAKGRNDARDFAQPLSPGRKRDHLDVVDGTSLFGGIIDIGKNCKPARCREPGSREILPRTTMDNHSMVQHCPTGSGRLQPNTA
jgi:hypothetical protein